MMPLPDTTLAAVTTGARRTELRELPVPPVAADSGLLQVEAAGVCGADVRSYERDAPVRVMGHENVGYIAAIGAAAAARWGVGEGDRVVLEEYLPCGHCGFCRSAEFRFCLASDASANPDAIRYGSTAVDTAPGLWGGYSQYMYLHPNTVVHRLPGSIPATVASLALPLGNGYEWACRYGEAGPGKTVVIFGPGQQGLGCVIAARAAGADRIILTGLPADRRRLEVGKLLGADEVIVADGDGTREAIMAATGGTGADTVIDTAAGSTQTLTLALEVLRKQGILVVPAASAEPLDGLPFGRITRKCITVRGARGHSYHAVEWALRLMAGDRYPLAEMCSLECGLDQVDRAIRGTGGELDVPVIHAAVLPGLETGGPAPGGAASGSTRPAAG
jgi:threonine dehydrogenase-like Zn-dependent dehydrogenase